MNTSLTRIVKPLAAVAALLLSFPAYTAYFDLGVGSYGANYRSPDGIPLDIARHDWAYICFGNEDGRMMKAVWLTDNFSYSAVVRGQGDISDTYGLAAEDVAALVTSIQ